MLKLGESVDNLTTTVIPDTPENGNKAAVSKFSSTQVMSGTLNGHTIGQLRIVNEPDTIYH